MQKNMTTQLVADAMTMAVWRRRPKAASLLHRSDQGSQYANELYQQLLADNGVQCSMSRTGNVWDNSAMESFFSSLNIERIHESGTVDGEPFEIRMESIVGNHIALVPLGRVGSDVVVADAMPRARTMTEVIPGFDRLFPGR